MVTLYNFIISNPLKELKDKKGRESKSKKIYFVKRVSKHKHYSKAIIKILYNSHNNLSPKIKEEPLRNHYQDELIE